MGEILDFKEKFEKKSIAEIFDSAESKDIPGLIAICCVVHVMRERPEIYEKLNMDDILALKRVIEDWMATWPTWDWFTRCVERMYGLAEGELDD